MGERQVSGQVWRLTAVAILMAASLTACGQDGGDDASDAGAHRSASGEPRATTTAPRPGESILIKTRFSAFRGKVLDGSVLGDSPFCPGGTVRHEHGSPELGFPAINVFDCADGRLRIGFGPGPDQLDNAVQTSSWEVIDGNGSFAGMSGEGQMTVRLARAGATKGQETFTGKVVLP